MQFRCKELAFSCEVGTKKIDQPQEVEQLARSRKRACRRRQDQGAAARNAREGIEICCRSFRQLPKFRTFLQELTGPHQHLPVGIVIAVPRAVMRGADAQDHEGSEWRGGLYSEWPVGRRKSGGVGNAVQSGSQRPPHHFGFNRADAGGPRRCPISWALRSREHPAQELSSIHPGMDRERARPELATHLAAEREHDGDAIGSNTRARIGGEKAGCRFTPACGSAATERIERGPRRGARLCRQEWRWTCIRNSGQALSAEDSSGGPALHRYSRGCRRHRPAELPKGFRPLAQVRREILLLHLVNADCHQRSPYVSAPSSRRTGDIDRRFKRE